MLTPPVTRIRISESGKNQLITLKKRTKIQQWNILCRWALCRSLAEPSRVGLIPLPSPSNVEMTWEVFAGPMSEELILAFRYRVLNDLNNYEVPVTDELLADIFRLHVHRGIGYLLSEIDVKSRIEDLAALDKGDMDLSGNWLFTV